MTTTTKKMIRTNENRKTAAQKKRNADGRMDHFLLLVPLFRVAEGTLLYYRKRYGSMAPASTERAARDHRMYMLAEMPAFAEAVRKDAFE